MTHLLSRARSTTHERLPSPPVTPHSESQDLSEWVDDDNQPGGDRQGGERNSGGSWKGKAKSKDESMSFRGFDEEMGVDPLMNAPGVYPPTSEEVVEEKHITEVSRAGRIHFPSLSRSLCILCSSLFPVLSSTKLRTCVLTDTPLYLFPLPFCVALFFDRI